MFTSIMSFGHLRRTLHVSLARTYPEASLQQSIRQEIARGRCGTSRSYHRRHVIAISKSDDKARYWLLSTVVAVGLATYLTQSPSVHLEAPQQQQLPDEKSAFRIDPSTSQPFPLCLPNPITPLPSSCGELSLVGLGVRTVSFLRVKVYVSALYIDSAALTALENIEGWRGFEKTWMLDSKSGRSGETLIASLLDRGITFAIRISEESSLKSIAKSKAAEFPSLLQFLCDPLTTTTYVMDSL